ncbi:MAG: hypothetical protein P4L36_21170 [Holophaga sp.]|nr:hypothetical protein [Holophaga sp.]
MQDWKRNVLKRTSWALLLCAGLALRADGLADLRATLRKLQGTDPVKVSVDYTFWRETSEEGGPVTLQGGVATRAEDGPPGLRIIWDRATLLAAEAEQRATTLAVARQAPTAQIMKSLTALDIAEHLNEGATLDRFLLQATLVDVRPDTWQARPATLLVVRLVPVITPPSLRRAVKEIVAQAQIWLAPDGTPLAYRSEVNYKGSRFMIHFQGLQKEEIHFLRVGSRLVGVWASNEEHQSGLGQSMTTRRSYRIALGEPGRTR